jgi:hippurate hydrolase
MDALPVTEKTGLPYASKTPGVMHACGHDIHMATALGTLRVLAARKEQWNGTILFVGQPAEEIGQGALDMLADPRLKGILRQVGKPRVALAIHDTSEQPAGAVGIKPGPVTANVDALDIVVNGKGGHGGAPHEAIDPVVIGAEIVMSLQTIVSRRVPPGEMGVITVGMFQAGAKHNIIPSEAKLLVSVRSYSSEIRNLLLGEINRVARDIAAAHRAPRPPTITQRPNHTPAAYNDPAWATRLEALFRKTLGEANVKGFEPSMGGEDFGRFASDLGIPGVMWRVGGVSKAAFEAAKRKNNGKISSLPPLHSDAWAPDPVPTLRTGILTMTLAILEALDSTPGGGSR